MNALLLLDQLYRDRLGQYFEEISEKTFFMDNTRKKFQLINQHLSRAPLAVEPQDATAYLQAQAEQCKQRVYAAAHEKNASKHLLPRQRSDVELTQQTASTSNYRTPLRSNTLEGDLHSHFEEATARSRPS